METATIYLLQTVYYEAFIFTHTKKNNNIRIYRNANSTPLCTFAQATPHLSIWLLAVVATCEKLTCKWSFLSRREGLPSGSYPTVTRRLIFACTDAACSGLRSSDLFVGVSTVPQHLSKSSPDWSACSPTQLRIGSIRIGNTNRQHQYWE